MTDQDKLGFEKPKVSVSKDGGKIDANSAEAKGTVAIVALVAIIALICLTVVVWIFKH
jgi:hypothetical protein